MLTNSASVGLLCARNVLKAVTNAANLRALAQPHASVVSPSAKTAQRATVVNATDASNSGVMARAPSAFVVKRFATTARAISTAAIATNVECCRSTMMMQMHTVATAMAQQ